MPKVVERPATYEDLLKVPEHLVAEIVDGELFTNPRPAPLQLRAASKLCARLMNTFDNSGEWVFLHQPELQLGEDLLIPAIAAWRRERMPTVPDVPALTLAPDWVCEVLSPSSERLVRVRKQRAYARHGLRDLWLIDPRQQTLEGFQLCGGQWAYLTAAACPDLARAEPFQAIELDLETLWT